MDNLFSTHPATENRIAALQAMAREASFGAPPRPALRCPPGRAAEKPAAGPWGESAGDRTRLRAARRSRQPESLGPQPDRPAGSRGR